MKNNKIIIATGGTGGHIFPALSLYKYFENKDYDVSITSDVRGLKFINKPENLKIKIIKASSFSIKNKVFAFFKIIYSIIESLYFLIKRKPKLVFGMGGYASFPICFSAIILNKPFALYENNLAIGKVNKYLLPYAKFIFIAYDSVEGIDKKYKDKTFCVGNILRPEILDYKKKNKKFENKLNILILGGSQAAKAFAEKLPNIFIKCKREKINFRIIQQCIKGQNEELKDIYDSNNIESELFNFSFDITEYYQKADLAISRAGSSALSELLYCKIPIIAIPLESSADNHQKKNAKYFEKKGFCNHIEEEEIDIKLFNFINLAYKDNSILEKIIKNQNNHDDGDVFNNINKELKDFI